MVMETKGVGANIVGLLKNISELAVDNKIKLALSALVIGAAVFYPEVLVYISPLLS